MSIFVKTIFLFKIQKFRKFWMFLTDYFQGIHVVFDVLE